MNTSPSKIGTNLVLELPSIKNSTNWCPCILQGQKYSRLAVAAVEDSVATDGDVDDLEEESPVAETEASDGAAKVTDVILYCCILLQSMTRLHTVVHLHLALKAT